MSEQQDYKECYECKKQIQQGQFSSIAGKHYHAQCFKCNKCEQPLVDGFIEDEGQYICEQCYNESTLTKCTRCNEFIKEQMVNVNDGYYHPECFTCYKCQQPFTDTKFLTQNEQNYCMTCAVDVSEFTCHECQKKITGKVFTAVNQHYHPECFKCKKCNKQITSKFRTVDDLHYHPDCDSKICAACHKPFDGEYFQIENTQDYIHKACLNSYKIIQANQAAKSNQNQENTDSIFQPSENGKYTLEQLKTNNYNKFIDVTKKETYLTDEDFQQVFNQTQEQFYQEPLWKQQKQKKQVGLF